MIKASILYAISQLNWKEKEALNILSIEYIRHCHISERPHPMHLIRQVTKKYLTYKYSDDIITKKQLGLLRQELRNFVKKHKNGINKKHKVWRKSSSL